MDGRNSLQKIGRIALHGASKAWFNFVQNPLHELVLHLRQMAVEHL